MSVAVLAVLSNAGGVLALVASILAGLAVWAGLSVAGGLLDLRRVRTIFT